MMSEKRFFVKVYSNNEPYFFDEKQEYVEERYTCKDVRNLHPMEYWQVVDLLNEQQATINRLEEEIKLLKPTNIEQYEQIQKLQKENEQLRKQVAEYEMILRQHEFAEQEGFR